MEVRAPIPSGAAANRSRNLEVAADEYGSSELVMKNRSIRFDEVRSEGKLLVSLLLGWAMIAP
jgi:hypothetical protein